MDFARLVEQAKELWSKPIGKLLIGGIAVFLVLLAVAGVVLTRPEYVPIGTFEATAAPEVATKLNEAKIPYTQTGNGYTFNVRQDDVNKAKLVLAELNLDPNTTVWAQDTWSDRVSWSQTEFDKRLQWVEQTESNLTRAIRALSVVEQARVQISVPTEPALFKSQEKAPKAMVVVWPRKGQELTTQVVEAIMETVAGPVEGLDKTAVTVVDASQSKVVSTDAFKPQSSVPGVGDDQLAIVRRYQEHFQTLLTQQLERVFGPNNVSVIVNPVINWDRVMIEAKEYKGAGPDGQGILLSQQNTSKSAEGVNPNNTTPVGTTPNTTTPPVYPSTPATGTGIISQDEKNSILNYLVDETKTTTERPGQAIEEIAVGVFVNKSQVEPATEQAIQKVVATAMTTKARVEVASMQFAAQPWDDLLTNEPRPISTGPSINWLVMALVIFLTLGGIGFFFVALRPRKPVLEPVFAGPEAAMMGGIPVSDFELAAAVDAYGAQATASVQPAEKTLPDSQAAAELPPEEMALLGDEFLQRLGVDPAKVRMKEKVEKIAKGNPEAVADLLKAWISDG